MVTSAGAVQACHCPVEPAPLALLRSAQGRGEGPGLSQGARSDPCPWTSVQDGVSPGGPCSVVPGGDEPTPLMTPNVLCSRFKRPHGPLHRALGSCLQLWSGPSALPITLHSSSDCLRVHRPPSGCRPEFCRHPLQRLTEANLPLQDPGCSQAQGSASTSIHLVQQLSQEDSSLLPCQRKTHIHRQSGSLPAFLSQTSLSPYWVLRRTPGQC